MTDEEMEKELRAFAKKLAEEQQLLEPEFEKVFWDNYWDLLE